jgi:EAL domain-containing protein (putative c-di-GMP-specific phosphodiesterase class I)
VLPPGRFLTLLEDAGLLPALGREIAAQAFDFRRRIDHLVPRGFRIAINIGVRDQAVPVIIERLIHQSVAVGVAPGGIALEITESAVINDLPGAARAISWARRHGFLIALDDFGTGFSSLALLRDLELDAVKIDRSFVARMRTSPADAAIVAGILDLAHRLGLVVIAEGVETLADVDSLRAQGAELAQGFRWSQAVPPDDFVHLVEATPPWITGGGPPRQRSRPRGAHAAEPTTTP